jgi:hypothetical protein
LDSELNGKLGSKLDGELDSKLGGELGGHIGTNTILSLFDAHGALPEAAIRHISSCERCGRVFRGYLAPSGAAWDAAEDWDESETEIGERDEAWEDAAYNLAYGAGGAGGGGLSEGIGNSGNDVNGDGGIDAETAKYVFGAPNLATASLATASLAVDSLATDKLAAAKLAVDSEYRRIYLRILGESSEYAEKRLAKAAALLELPLEPLPAHLSEPLPAAPLPEPPLAAPLPAPPPDPSPAPLPDPSPDPSPEPSPEPKKEAPGARLNSFFSDVSSVAAGLVSNIKSFIASPDFSALVPAGRFRTLAATAAPGAPKQYIAEGKLPNGSAYTIAYQPFATLLEIEAFRSNPPEVLYYRASDDQTAFRQHSSAWTSAKPGKWTMKLSPDHPAIVALPEWNYVILAQSYKSLQ